MRSTFEFYKNLKDKSGFWLIIAVVIAGFLTVLSYLQVRSEYLAVVYTIGLPLLPAALSVFFCYAIRLQRFGWLAFLVTFLVCGYFAYRTYLSYLFDVSPFG